MRSLGAFGPEAIAEMSEALEAACEELGDNVQPEAVREIVALRIIAAARLGERDPVRLREVALRKRINDPQWRPGVAACKAVSDSRCDPDSFQSKVAQSHGIEHAGLGEGDYMIRDNAAVSFRSTNRNAFSAPSNASTRIPASVAR